MSQRFVIRRDFIGFPLGEYEVKFGEINADGTVNTVEPLKLRKLEEGERVPVMMVLDADGIQSLMDELWKTGARPSDVGTAGHLAATQSHLSDMKKLVSKAYGVEL